MPSFSANNVRGGSVLPCSRTAPIGVPLLFTATYLIAAFKGHVPWCFPPIDGCTDITHTGFEPPESFLFRFGLIPIAVVMGLLFYFFKEWLEMIAGRPLGRARASFYLALAGSICLNASTSLIQGQQDTPINVHAVFASSFFILMFISQLLYTLQDYRLRIIEKPLALWIRIISMALQLLLILINLINWIVTGERPDSAFEWQITLAYVLWFASFLFERDTVFTNHYRRRHP